MQTVSYFYKKNTDSISLSAALQLSSITISQLTNGCLFGILITEEREKRIFSVETGIIDLNLKFYACPILIGHVQINSIITEKRHRRISTNIKLWDSVFKKHINVAVSGDREDIKSIDKLINTLNSYVELGNDINDLNTELFAKNRIEKEYLELDHSIFSRGIMTYLYHMNIFEVIRAIDNLSFAYYINGQSRVGRDDFDWYEIELTNTPTNSYTKDLLFLLLQKCDFINKMKDKDGYWLLEYDLSSAVSFNRREKREEDKEFSNKLKNYLKMNILPVFNPREELNERLKIQNTTNFAFIDTP